MSEGQADWGGREGRKRERKEGGEKKGEREGREGKERNVEEGGREEEGRGRLPFQQLFHLLQPNIGTPCPSMRAILGR